MLLERMAFSFIRLQRTGALLGLLMGLGLGHGVAQASPQILRIDGSLFNASGAPITGSRDIQIKAFDAATGGSVVWTSSVYNTSVANGRFAIALDATADTTTLTNRLATKAANGEIWFEIHYDTGSANGTMNSDVTVAPRIRGKGTMFALVAAKADALTGVTATAAEMNYLSGVTANLQSQIASTSAGGTTKVSKSGDSMSGALEVGSTITNTGVITAGTNHDTTALNGAYKIGGVSMLSVGTGANSGNIMIGNTAIPTSGIRNIFIGKDSGGAGAVTGDFNEAMGWRSAFSLSSGSNNLMLGSSAGYNTMNGSDNTFVGTNAGNLNVAGVDNAYFGELAGYNATGSYNTFLGKQAGYSVTSANNLTLVGYYANGNTTAAQSAAIGYYATVNASSAVQLGSGVNSTPSSLQFWNYNFLDKNGAATFASVNGVTTLTSAYLNGLTANIQTQIANAGGSAAASKVSKSGDSMSGALEVGSNITNTGLITSGSGYDTLNPNPQFKIAGTTLIAVGSGYGAGNIFIGGNPGTSITSGTNNMILGNTGTGALLTTGSSNLLLGKFAGQGLTTGSGNVFLGWGAGQNTVSASSNVSIGQDAGKTNVSGGDNTYIGGYSGISSTASYNTTLGAWSGVSVTTGAANTLIGANSGYNLVGGSNNTFVGRQAAQSASSGDDNTVVGGTSGLNLTTGNRNLVVGASANTGAATSGSVALGYNAVATASSAIQIGVGTNATADSLQIFDVNLTRTELNFLDGATANLQTQINNGSAGSKVSKSGDSMSGALEVGSTIVSTGNVTSAGVITAGTAHDTTSANGKYKIGGYTILAVSTGFGANNLFVGTNSGSSLTSGTNNMVMGSSSGSALTSGSQNLFIGPYLTGSNTTSGTHNVFLGSYAGATHQTSSDNTFLGYYSGYNTKGQGNTLVGSAAGMTVSTQSFNTLVGFGADDSLGTASGSVAVGYSAIVTGSSAVQLGQGTNSTANTLQFQGYNFLDKNGAATFASINGVTTVTSAYLNGLTANIQTQINASSATGKVSKTGDTMTGNLGFAYTGVTPSRVAYIGASRELQTSTVVDNTELDTLDGVTSNLGARVNLFTNTQAGYLGGVTASLISQLGGLTANVQTQLNSTARLSGLVSGQVVVANGVSGVTTATGTGTDAITWDATNKRVGVGTTSPSSTLDVRGQIRSVASGGSVQSNATASIDWSLGNVQIMTASCGPGTVNVTFSNMIEGGSYTLIVTGTTSGTCTFSQTSPNTLASSAFKFMPVNGDTANGTTTVYTFSRAGNLVYVSWITGYN